MFVFLKVKDNFTNLQFREFVWLMGILLKSGYVEWYTKGRGVFPPNMSKWWVLDVGFKCFGKLCIVLYPCNMNTWTNCCSFLLNVSATKCVLIYGQVESNDFCTWQLWATVTWTAFTNSLKTLIVKALIWHFKKNKQFISPHITFIPAERLAWPHP